MKIHTSLLLLLISITQITTFAQDADWETPIGIPVPSFGINETYRIYDDAAKRTASGLTYQVSAGGGYFTHYVDSSDPASTDSSNVYGSIAKPRKSVPSILSAGSIVEIHNTILDGAKRVTCNGTEELPVFVRGIDDPSTISGYLIRGCYAIWEGIKVKGTFAIRQADGVGIGHHICIRDCESYNDGTFGNLAGITIDGVSTETFHNIVLYNNHIHHGGDSEYATENDNHGVEVKDYVQYVWILGNNIHHMGGDGIQLCHGANFTSNHIYIGGNVMYDNRENAVDIKQCNDVIVSQNECYGYEACSSDPGGALVVHYDPNNVWFLFNKIHDANFGIISSGCLNQYIIGNVIYNIRGSDTPSTPYSPHRQGIGIRWYNTNTPYVLNNTLYNCVTGIGADILTSTVNISNNIISERNPSTDGYHMAIMGKGLPGSVMENNLFYQTGEQSKIYWGGSYNGVAAFQTGTGKGTGCVETNPLFVDSLNGDFNLQQSSPVNNLQASSQAQAVYDRFLQLYGVDLAADIAGKERTFIVPSSVPDSTDTSSTNSSSEDVLPNNTDTSNTASSNADVLPDNSIDTGITQETQNSSPVVTDTANQVPQSSGTESNNTATNNTSDTTQATNTSPITSTSQTTGTTQITGTTQVSNSGTHDNSRRSRMTGFITTKVTPKKIFGRYDDIYNTAKRGWTVKKEYFE